MTADEFRDLLATHHAIAKRSNWTDEALHMIVLAGVDDMLPPEQASLAAEVLSTRAERDAWKRRAERAEAEEKNRCVCKFGPDHKEVKICEWHQFIVQQSIGEEKDRDALAAQNDTLREVLTSGMIQDHWYTCDVLTNPDYKGSCDERCERTRRALALDLSQAARIAETATRLCKAVQGSTFVLQESVCAALAAWWEAKEGR